MEATLTAKPEANAKTHAASPAPMSSTSPLENEIGATAGLPIFLQRSVLSWAGGDGIELKCDDCTEEDEKEHAGLQFKLIVGAPNDPYEQEADRVADEVTAHQCSACAGGGPCSDCASKSSAAPANNLFQTKPATRAPAAHSLPSDIAPASSGSPVPLAVRHKVEPVLGVDFSDVQVHTDAAAQVSAKRLQAKAFTHHNHIWLGPHQSAGDVSLMAHELTHVVQQSGVAAPAQTIQRQPETNPAPAPARNAESNEEAQRVADRIYQALDGWNNESAAIQAMQGHGAGMRSLIEARFQDTYHLSLRGYLKDQLDGDWLVYAYALLNSSNIYEQHTAMALALIPVGTRDEEIFRIFYSLPLAGRQELERRYNETFGTAGNGALKIGTGSLQSDLKDDLSGWRKEKSLALLNRDLTSADELYFDSVGITGTHTGNVISRIQSEWDHGPMAFAVLERDWDQLVCNGLNWTDETWTTMSLYSAMDDELSGEDWELVRAVLRGYERYKSGVSEELGQSSLTNVELAAHEQEIAGQPVSEQATFARETNELQVANESLTAATTGGITGAGTNEEQVFRAVSTIRRIWTDRIQRARTAGDEARARDYEQQWEAQRLQLMTVVESEMDTDTVEYRRSRLLTAGDLTPADEVYLASQDLDSDKVVSLLTTYWAQGRMNQLLAQAREPRRAPAAGTVSRPGVADTGAEIRPSFNVLLSVPVTSGTTFHRVAALTREDRDDAQRGTARLRIELDEGDNDSDLRKAYEFLTTSGIEAGLRNSVVQQYAASISSDETAAATPVQKFLDYLSRRYENSNAYWDFRDLLQPSNDPQELLTRSQGRNAAAHTGILDATLNDLVRDYDLITGEDTQQVVSESQNRLRFIAQNAQANPQELQAMMSMTGARSPEELAGMEYNVFRQRLDELRELRRSIAEAVATAVQLTIELALTVVTAGAAGPMLLASLAATVASIATRELLLGQDYDTLSRENAQALVLAVASHGFGAAGRGAFAEIISPERLRQLGRAGAFVESAVTEGFTQIGSQTVSAAFDGRMPTVESIGAAALSIAGSAAGAGMRGRIAHSITEHTPDMTRLRTLVISNATQNVIGGVTEEGANLVRSGVGNLTGGEIAMRLGRRTGEGIVRGVTSGVGDFGAQHVAAERQRRAGQQDADEEMEDLAHDPAGLPPGQHGVVAHPTGETTEPRIVRVVRVNERHTISVLLHPDGSVSVTICSNGCGRIRQVLTAAQNDHAANPEHVIHAHIQPLLDEVARIEAALRTNPNDEAANLQLQQLAQRVNALLGLVGENAIFVGPEHHEEEAPASAVPVARPRVVPTPTAPEYEKIDAYVQALARLRQSRMANDAAGVAAAIAIMDDIETLALERHNQDGPYNSLLDHIGTLEQARRALQTGQLRFPIETHPGSGEFVEGIGHQFSCMSTGYGSFRRKTYREVEAILGVPKVEGTPPGRVRLTWRFGDDSFIHLDVPGTENESPFMINRQPHLSRHAPIPNQELHLSDDGIGVPLNSTPAHIEIVSDSLLQQRILPERR